MSYIVEVSLAIVPVQTGWLELEMGLDDVEVSVEVIVADANAHSGHLLAVRADCDAAHQALFAKGAVVIIQEQKTLSRVAGHKEIWPSIFVDVEGNSREPVGTLDRGDAGFFRNIGE